MDNTDYILESLIAPFFEVEPKVLYNEPMANAWFITKIILSGIIIAFASSLAGKRPLLAGFIVALPLMSILSLLFSYIEFKDMAKASTFAVSILTAVPLSLLFFLPFVLNRWLKFGFFTTYFIGLGCVAVGYLAHSIITKRFF